MLFQSTKRCFEVTQQAHPIAVSNAPKSPKREELETFNQTIFKNIETYHKHKTKGKTTRGPRISRDAYEKSAHAILLWAYRPIVRHCGTHEL